MENLPCTGAHVSDARASRLHTCARLQIRKQHDAQSVVIPKNTQQYAPARSDGNRRRSVRGFAEASPTCKPQLLHCRGAGDGGGGRRATSLRNGSPSTRASSARQRQASSKTLARALDRRRSRLQHDLRVRTLRSRVARHARFFARLVALKDKIFVSAAAQVAFRLRNGKLTRPPPSINANSGACSMRPSSRSSGEWRAIACCSVSRSSRRLDVSSLCSSAVSPVDLPTSSVDFAASRPLAVSRAKRDARRQQRRQVAALAAADGSRWPLAFA